MQEDNRQLRLRQDRLLQSRQPAVVHSHANHRSPEHHDVAAGDVGHVLADTQFSLGDPPKRPPVSQQLRRFHSVLQTLNDSDVQNAANASVRQQLLQPLRHVEQLLETLAEEQRQIQREQQRMHESQEVERYRFQQQHEEMVAQQQADVERHIHELSTSVEQMCVKQRQQYMDELLRLDDELRQRHAQREDDVSRQLAELECEWEELQASDARARARALQVWNHLASKQPLDAFKTLGLCPQPVSETTQPSFALTRGAPTSTGALAYPFHQVA